ncbi:hypothetical protein NLU13_4818 [Sarocladium strictum]|uniref:2-dehydropantoate 2-reductase n=1 Tax=Sarocladium strictum TaxID=5046 RepID=A0AA39GJL7_SARSR|nr:hypothetical protein NLU13_4818 [Sarocladium strictum]
MPSEKPIDVLVYGLGAIGGFYAFILSRVSDVRVSVVARSNYEAVKANGLIINSEHHGEHVVHPYKVVTKAAETEMKFDYIVCAHKAIHQDAVPADIEAAVDPARTTIVIIQNGVGNEEPFRESFPSTTIISCVTWTGAIQAKSGRFTQMKNEDMQIGLFPNEAGDQTSEKHRLDDFARLLTGGRARFQVVENIQVQRWEKVVWNVAWNSLTTLTLCDTQTWLHSSPQAQPMTRRLMCEVIDVAQRCGVPIKHGLADEQIAMVTGLGPIGSSMQTDYKAGRPMEVEIILGYPVRKARELNMQTPTLETIYLILTAINGRLLKEAEKETAENGR